SDLMAMIYGTHGEIPKVVFAPSTIEESFFDTIEAFNIAEEYQIHVILLADFQLSLAKQTVEPFDYSKIRIRHGNLVDAVEPEGKKSYFKRFEITTGGISPRGLPGTKGGIHHVTGVEHDETGKPMAGAANRKKQMEKRLVKLNNFTIKDPIYFDSTTENPDLLLVGFNSTRGVLEEVKERLMEEGIFVNHLHIRLLHPFPSNL